VRAQTAHQIEGLSLRPLPGQGQRVVGHALLDGRPHLRRRPEETIRRHRATNALVRAAEVVGLDKQRDPTLAVVEVRKHRPREKLLPQRLPESLDLSQGLRVVRAALDVTDTLAMELGLEVGVPTPGDVLASLIRQDLTWSAVLGNPTSQSFKHERRTLVMRHHQRHEVPRVVVHEGGHVQTLVPPQKKREDVRLPELIRLRALESILGWTRLGRGLLYRLQ
jgi:hypothetical protein